VVDFIKLLSPFLRSKGVGTCLGGKSSNEVLSQGRSNHLTSPSYLAFPRVPSLPSSLSFFSNLTFSERTQVLQSSYRMLFRFFCMFSLSVCSWQHEPCFDLQIRVSRPLLSPASRPQSLPPCFLHPATCSLFPATCSLILVLCVQSFVVVCGLMVARRCLLQGRKLRIKVYPSNFDS
jgi:hypothetical protein